jgi:hypothetical protein
MALNDQSVLEYDEQVLNFSNAGLFEADTRGAWEHASARVRYECIRLASLYKCDLDKISAKEIKSFEDYECLWDYFEKFRDSNVREPEAVDPLTWKLTGEGFGEGKLVFNSTGSDRLFRLQLEPLRRELACRFQRAFGGDRFLYLSVPSLVPSKLPSHLKSKCDNIRSNYKEWLRNEKAFLGCKWTTVLVEKKQEKKLERLSYNDEGSAQSLILFATEVSHQKCSTTSHDGKHPCTCSTQLKIRVDEMVNWLLPTRLNIGLPQCKAYSRLELGFSKTWPTLIFRPSQIREVQDTFADGSSESARFLEEGQNLRETFDPSDRKVMNDGCSLISAAAAQEIARKLGLSGHLPGVFQARIGCWKGLWMTDIRSTGTPDRSKNDIWIEVTPSQTKFCRYPEDRKDSIFDPKRTTFEVVTWSMPTAPSRLSRTLIPILTDRKVPEANLHGLFRASLEYEEKSMLNAAGDPQLLHQWVYSKASFLENERTNSETE